MPIRRTRTTICALLLTLGALAQGLQAQESSNREILVKGLTQGRAILLVDDELVILNVGESRRGVRLLGADTRGATLEIDGRRVTMGLDQSIARSYSAPQPANQSQGDGGVLFRERSPDEARRGRTRVTAVRLLDSTDSSITLDVDYFYAGDRGADQVLISVTSLRNGESTGYARQTEATVVAGASNAVIEVGMTESAPAVYYSDGLRITFNWLRDGRRQGALVSQLVPFTKYWKKVRVR